jgi:hypothetical protein
MNEKFNTGSVGEKIFHNPTRGEYTEYYDERSAAVVVVVVDIKSLPNC